MTHTHAKCTAKTTGQEKTGGQQGQSNLPACLPNKVLSLASPFVEMRAATISTGSADMQAGTQENDKNVFSRKERQMGFASKSLSVGS